MLQHELIFKARQDNSVSQQCLLGVGGGMGVKLKKASPQYCDTSTHLFFMCLNIVYLLQKDRDSDMTL